MADLKIGTTIGGTAIWGKVNLPLTPSGNTLLYKTYKIFTENDLPTATELGVVSRAGDTMTGALRINSGSTTTPGLLVGALTHKAVMGVSSVAGEVLFGAAKTGGDFSAYVRIGHSNTAFTFSPDAITQYKIYHEGFKPTAADVGALALTGGTMTGPIVSAQTVQFRGKQSGTVDVNTLISETSGDWGYASNVNGDSTNCFPMSNNANAVLHFNVHGGKFARQLGFSSNGAMYTRYRDGTNWSGWRKMYDEANKPTTTEISAMPVGDLSQTSDVNSTSNGHRAYNVAGGAPNWAYGGSGGAMLQMSHGGYLSQLAFKSVTPGMVLRAKNPNTGNWSSWGKVYTAHDKPTAADVGLGNVPNTVHTTAANGNTVAVRDANGDIHCRLVRTTYADEPGFGGGIVFRRNNGSDNYLRTCNNPANVRAWLSLDTANSPTFAGLTVNSNPTFNNCSTIVIANPGRKHIRFDDTGVDGYIWKDPGQPWNINHGSKANSTLLWTQNGELVTDGARWAVTHSHGYAGQPGLSAPFTVNFGSVSGASDYYPIVRGISASDGYGYTTQIDLGCLREGNNQWGRGVLRVGSHENSSHPSAVFYFKIDGEFYSQGNVNANDVYIRSDERMKSDFLPINNALTKVNQLEGKTYVKHRSLTDNTSVGREAGLIAQDVMKVLPEAVKESEDSTLTISPAAVNALLVEAIKELTALNANLTKRIEALENGRS